MVDLSDLIVYVLLPWMIIIERRLSRLEGLVNLLIKTLSYNKEKGRERG
jgi:hypothetical protein